MVAAQFDFSNPTSLVPEKDHIFCFWLTPGTSTTALYKTLTHFHVRMTILTFYWKIRSFLRWLLYGYTGKSQRKKMEIEPVLLYTLLSIATFVFYSSYTSRLPESSAHWIWFYPKFSERIFLFILNMLSYFLKMNPNALKTLTKFWINYGRLKTRWNSKIVISSRGIVNVFTRTHDWYSNCRFQKNFDAYETIVLPTDINKIKIFQNSFNVYRRFTKDFFIVTLTDNDFIRRDMEFNSLDCRAEASDAFKMIKIKLMEPPSIIYVAVT